MNNKEEKNVSHNETERLHTTLHEILFRNFDCINLSLSQFRSHLQRNKNFPSGCGDSFSDENILLFLKTSNKIDS